MASREASRKGARAVPYSFLTRLECARCRRTYDADRVMQLCACGGPLLARYDLEAAREHLSPGDLARREPDLWRYHELLPVRDPQNVVTLGEGMTPLIPLRRLGKRLGLPGLFLKDEGVLPTGTFKARGAAVGVSRAMELGVRTLAMPTNGNAGGAWATYAARAGMKAWILMPKAAPPVARIECAATGARLFLVDGHIGDAGRIVAKAVARFGWFDASTLKEPYRIEGKKTMGFEIVEQFEWKVPDVIVYPTGGGVGLIGIYKALLELQALGWLPDRPLPRLVAVQSTGCAPIVRAWDEGRSESEPWPDPSTVAFGINVPKALGDFLVLEALRRTGGCALAVTDAEILEARAELARLEGIFACPEGSATLAAVKRLRQNGWIAPSDRVVCLNTGSGLKYPETVQVNVPVLTPDADLPTDV